MGSTGRLRRVVEVTLCDISNLESRPQQISSKKISFTQLPVALPAIISKSTCHFWSPAPITRCFIHAGHPGNTDSLKCLRSLPDCRSS